MKHYDENRISKCCNSYDCDKCGNSCDTIEVQTLIYKAGVMRDEKGLLKIFKKWVKNHPDVFHDMDGRFWYVQNAVGDLLGWSKEYSNFISKLIKKYDGKIS